jgi:hypothetical protein
MIQTSKLSNKNMFKFHLWYCVYWFDKIFEELVKACWNFYIDSPWGLN